MKKKYILIFNLFCFNICNAQDLNDSMIKEFKGFSTYVAGSVALAEICKFPKNEIEAVHNSHIKHISQISTDLETKKEIANQFISEIKIFYNKGISGFNISCDDYSKEFKKIYNFTKNKQ